MLWPFPVLKEIYHKLIFHLEFKSECSIEMIGVDMIGYIGTGLLVAAIIAFLLMPYLSNEPEKVLEIKKVEANQEYTAEEVAKHKTRDDCWIIVEGKVYDITSYIDNHPGGDSIMNRPGEDITEEFNGEQHPNNVHDVIESYQIGVLV